MNATIKTVILAGLALAPFYVAEARCCGRNVVTRRVVCRPANCSPVRIGGGCRKYSWVGDTPRWKQIPEDCHSLEKAEFEQFRKAFELVPSKIRKIAARPFDQRAQYLKRPNAARDRSTFVAKLAKRSGYQRKKLPDEYVLKMYDEMLIYGRSLIFGECEYEPMDVANLYGFTKVADFIGKVLTTSEKKMRNWEYPMDNPEFRAFDMIARCASSLKWAQFKWRIGKTKKVCAGNAKCCRRLKKM